MAASDDTIQVGGREVLRFHPLGKKIKDDIPRCIHCGQIDEEPYHEAAFCPGHGGWIPFPTSKLRLKLSTDTGFDATVEQRLYLEQWVAIQAILDDHKRAQQIVADVLEARRLAAA